MDMARGTEMLKGGAAPEHQHSEAVCQVPAAFSLEVYPKFKLLGVWQHVSSSQ